MLALVRCLGLGLLLAAGSALAGPKEELHDAFGKFMEAKSFRATVTDAAKGRLLSRMEYVAPDRYHMRTGEGPETYIVGDDGWMEVDGRLMKMPIPVGKIVAQYRNQNTLKELTGGMSVTALGDDEVDGEPASVYTYAVTQPIKADMKAWISKKTGLPLQIESSGSFMGVKSTTRIRYSDFDDPSIRIATPE